MITELAFISLFYSRPKLFIVLGLLPELGALILFSIYLVKYLKWLNN